jgi:dephospho-CoA kinase
VIQLVGFVGFPGSGKSTAIEAIKSFGPLFIMGDVVREETVNQGLELTGPNIANTAKGLREKHGENVISERIIEKIKEVEKTVEPGKKQIVIIDGLRSDKEFNNFKQSYPITVIFLDCPDEVRYSRLSQRGRKGDATEVELHKKRDEMEIGFGLLKLKDLAEYTVDASLPIEKMQEKCVEVVNQIINKK